MLGPGFVVRRLGPMPARESVKTSFIDVDLRPIWRSPPAESLTPTTSPASLTAKTLLSSPPSLSTLTTPRAGVHEKTS